MKRYASVLLFAWFVFVLATLGMARAWAAQNYAVSGLVLEVDPAHQTVLVSCNAIPGFMEAMSMRFKVRDSKSLDGLKAGVAVEFTLVAAKGSSFAENFHARPFESLELDPTQARRLKLMEKMARPQIPEALSVGQTVPNFSLVDQNRSHVTLSQFQGKVVAVTFVYTRCPFPNYCFRLSNNFGQLQKRFRQQMGRDLVLLSIVIDPAHDGPEALSNYARIWKADSEGWHFLTGPLPEIEEICRKFDMNFYPEEALLVHSFHTAIIDRKTKLVANIEGNDFSAKQLGDLVETLLERRN